MPPPPQTRTTSFTTVAKSFGIPATARDRIINLYSYDNRNEDVKDK
jgi:hypothetical protein